MKSRYILFLVVILISGCSPADVQPVDQTPIAALPSATLPSATPLPTGTPLPLEPTASQTPTLSPTLNPTPTATSPGKLWSSFASPANMVWALDENEPYQIDLPFEIGQYYDYAPATGRILYASNFAETGAGPGNIAVSDLRTLDLVSDESQTIIDENLVAQGRWLPNGEDLAYILATPATYELRLRRASGEDLLLASDVSFAWSVSPSGEYIAFSRESGYETLGKPGLYVVHIASGEERQLSDIDKAGTGSLDDRPIWSPDSKYVFFSNWGANPEDGGKRLVSAAVDGSETNDIEIAQDLADEWWADGSVSNLLVYPDQNRLVGLTAGSKEPYGPSTIMVFDLDPRWQTIQKAAEVSDAAALIDWDVIGESVWALEPGGELARLDLPE